MQIGHLAATLSALLDELRGCAPALRNGRAARARLPWLKSLLAAGQDRLRRNQERRRAISHWQENLTMGPGPSAGTPDDRWRWAGSLARQMRAQLFSAAEDLDPIPVIRWGSALAAILETVHRQTEPGLRTGTCSAPPPCPSSLPTESDRQSSRCHDGTIEVLEESLRVLAALTEVEGTLLRIFQLETQDLLDQGKKTLDSCNLAPPTGKDYNES